MFAVYLVAALVLLGTDLGQMVEGKDQPTCDDLVDVVFNNAKKSLPDPICKNLQVSNVVATKKGNGRTTSIELCKCTGGTLVLISRQKLCENVASCHRNFIPFCKDATPRCRREGVQIYRCQFLLSTVVPTTTTLSTAGTPLALGTIDDWENLP